MSKIDLIKIPKHEIHKIGNITNVNYFDDFQPLEMLKIFIPVGSFEEPIPGLAMLTMQMLLNGTKKYTANEISSKTEEKGIRISSFSNWDNSMLSVFFLKEHFETAKEILTSCFLEPAFDEDEIERQKKKTMSAIELKLVEPEYLASLTFLGKFFADTPYGHARNGTIESIKSITKDDCVNFYNKLMEQEIFFSVTGDFQDSHVSSVINTIKKDKPGIELAKQDFISPKLPYSLTIADRPDATQSSVIAGLPAINRFDQDYPSLQVLNVIYGGYFGSRLNQILREEKGYTYGIYSMVDSRKNTSLMKIASDLDNQYLDKMLPVLSDEAKKLMNEPVPEEELLTARNYMLGSFLRNTETPFQISAIINSIYINNLPVGYYENYVDKINKTSIEDIQKIAIKHFAKKEFTIAIAGNKKLIKL